MKFYFDSSALAKRYILEKGSERVDKLFFDAETVLVNYICLPEIVSALSRRRREKKMNSQQYQHCKRAAIEDFSSFDVCQLSPEVLNTAIHILESSELRASDAIHVSCAIHAKASRFISGDFRQLAVAKQFDLAVESV